MRRGSTSTDCSFFDGMASAVGVLLTLDEPGAEAAVSRLSALAAPDGWPQATVGPPKYLPDARIQDVTLGTAGVMLAALWARRHAVSGAREVAEQATEVLVVGAEQAPTGLNWRMVPLRFRPDGSQTHMPNFTHGLAGIAASLAESTSRTGAIS